MLNLSKKILSVLLCTVAILLNTSLVSEVLAKKDSNPGHCSANPFLKIEAPGPFEASAPEGQVITKVFVKAGSEQSDGGCFEYSEDTNDGCYNIVGIGTASVVVTRVGDGSECKEISHVEFEAEDSSDEDPEDDSDQDPGDGDDGEDEKVPGDDEGGDEGSDDSSTPQNTGAPVVEEKQGEVLGADTLAATSSLDFAVLAQSLGLIVTGLGLAYGKKK